ncbi:UPF0644 protein PB2B4.06 [Seiridium cupressi]
MYRPQQLSKLVVQPTARRLLPVPGPHWCAANGLRAAPAERWIRRSLATTPIRPQGEPLNTQAPTTESTTPEPQPQHAPVPKPTPRRRRGYIYAAIFLLLGTSVGSLFRLSVSPPPLPEPGTKENDYMVASIHEKAEELPLIQLLSSDPSWESWHAYGTEERRRTLTSDAMSGCRGLAYQRIFHKRETGEMINIVYFGGGLSGFPGVVHGGALATLLDESLGRCAICRFPARTGVTANLALDYKKPTLTNAFYVLKMRPVITEGDEIVSADGRKKSDRKLWVQGTLETPEGKVCIEANALFVVPKKAKPNPMADRW